MPETKITPRPGIITQATPTLAEGAFVAGNLVRFRAGLAQPVGGWQRASQAKLDGMCRALLPWARLDGTRMAAAATHSKLQVLRGTSLYDITPTGLGAGRQDAAVGQGFGTGGFGRGTWGTPRGSFNSASMPRLWTLDAWGEELVACVRDSGIFRWRPADGTGTPASLVAGAPTVVKCILVGMPERHLIAFGADIGGNQDPLLIRWSDTENYGVWTATATNGAGSFRLATGSQIMAALRGSGEHLVWTDAGLWSMRFIGGQFIYGFTELGSGCGLASPRAAVVHDGVAYWMSGDGFRRYRGAVEDLPCDVREAVSYGMTEAQRTKVFAGYNSLFGEVMWFYPEAGEKECSAYVSLDVATGAWSMGRMPRCAWADAGLFRKPLAVGTDGSLYWQETGTDADGSPMNPWIETGMFDMGDGTQFMALTELLPDFAVADGAAPVLLTVKAQDEPAAALRTKGPYAVTAATRRLEPRLRGRQMALRAESNALGASWRWGAPRALVAADGRR